MKIGIPTETKPDEYRVALLPVGAEELVRAGHEVLLQQAAGAGSGLTDEAYAACGARLVESAEEVFAEAHLIVKVKEPQPPELSVSTSTRPSRPPPTCTAARAPVHDLRRRPL